ncbi:MAG: hypothetical protein ABW175_02860 [Bradyrhizobium sp.]
MSRQRLNLYVTTILAKQSPEAPGRCFYKLVLGATIVDPACRKILPAVGLSQRLEHRAAAFAFCRA